MNPYTVNTVSVPDPKPPTAWIAFSIMQYARQMRSGDKTNEILANKFRRRKGWGQKGSERKEWREWEGAIHIWCMWTELVPLVTWLCVSLRQVGCWVRGGDTGVRQAPGSGQHHHVCGWKPEVCHHVWRQEPESVGVVSLKTISLVLGLASSFCHW